MEAQNLWRTRVGTSDGWQVSCDLPAPLILGNGPAKSSMNDWEQGFK